MPFSLWMRFAPEPEPSLRGELVKVLSFPVGNCCGKQVFCISCQNPGESVPRDVSMSVLTKSVLIVDDGPLLRQKLCEILRREGDFDVCGEAGDGQEAIAKAQQLHPDLIILDLSMPGMNGLEAVRVLRESIPSTPIIMFSNYSDAFVKKLALSLGVAAVISKSQSISVLLRTARGLSLKRTA